MWLVNYEVDSVTLQVSLTADFDQDGDVDSDDLVQWRSDFGGPGSDADGDGDTDGEDFLAWQNQFTGSITPPGSLTATVPEPSSVALSLLCLAMMFALKGIVPTIPTRRVR